MKIICSLETTESKTSTCHYCCIYCDNKNCQQRCYIAKRHNDDENEILTHCLHADKE